MALTFTIRWLKLYSKFILQGTKRKHAPPTQGFSVCQKPEDQFDKNLNKKPKTKLEPKQPSSEKVLPNGKLYGRLLGTKQKWIAVVTGSNLRISVLISVIWIRNCITETSFYFKLTFRSDSLTWTIIWVW